MCYQFDLHETGLYQSQRPAYNLQYQANTKNEQKHFLCCFVTTTNPGIQE